MASNNPQVQQTGSRWNQTLYTALGVRFGANKDTIDEAYLDRRKENSPANNPQAAERLERIDLAHVILSDEAARIGYDASLQEMDYYGVLGISKHAPPDKIESAFDRLFDKYQAQYIDEPKVAEANLHRISNAYEVLSNPAEKAKYDTWLEENSLPFGKRNVTGKVAQIAHNHPVATTAVAAALVLGAARHWHLMSTGAALGLGTVVISGVAIKTQGFRAAASALTDKIPKMFHGLGLAQNGLKDKAIHAGGIMSKSGRAAFVWGTGFLAGSWGALNAEKLGIGHYADIYNAAHSVGFADSPSGAMWRVAAFGVTGIIGIGAASLVANFTSGLSKKPIRTVLGHAALLGLGLFAFGLYHACTAPHPTKATPQSIKQQQVERDKTKDKKKQPANKSAFHKDERAETTTVLAYYGTDKKSHVLPNGTNVIVLGKSADGRQTVVMPVDPNDRLFINRHGASVYAGALKSVDSVPRGNVKEPSHPTKGATHTAASRFGHDS